ncbi:MAG TPA: protease modulator HflC [Steroidobacteraceae bacterium]|jgi:membrane protease subunit HflC|nr:protease modulator HflC [Steroidobacteraceae bacterium]
MNNRILALLIAAVAVFVVASNSLFKVNETELAIKFRFGEIVRSDYEPGLHVMVPFVNNVRSFDRRVLTRNYPSEQFLTSEGKILNVDFYVKWRINDVAQYYQSTNGDEEMAARRLAEIVKDGLKGVIARRTIQQVVAAQRAEFIGDILDVAGESVRQLGITLVDVRVKKIDLPDDVLDSVFNRMRQDFARQAAQLRAEGDELAQTVRAAADRERTELLAEATREAEKIRGEGDATAAAIYAGVYQRNPEFYAFHRSLQAYRKALGKPDDIMVIAPDSDFFRYMNKPGR